MGLQFNLEKESLCAIEDGISLEDFRAQVMKKLQSQIVPIGPLDPEYRASYGSLARETGRQSGPFRSFGDQILAVYNAGIPGGRIDQRLNILNASGLGTSIPSEGGWLVQTDFSTALLDRMNKTAVLAPKCWHVPIGANADGLEMPTIDETSRATGSRWGGVQVYRRAEADTVTAKKPKFGNFELRLEDLMGLCYTSNRQLKDGPSTGAIISRAFEEEFSFVLDNEIVRGSGVGECLGILNSTALVTVTKETGQAADSIVVENLVKMFTRMPARYRKNAFWAINQEIEPQLFTMGLIIGMGGSPVFLPGGSISGEPYGTLFGRPIIPIEQAAALGDLGDIMFLNLDQYCIIEKGGIEATESIHVRFIYDESCFKFLVRNNGAPLWKSALTPYKGAQNLSPFVVLEAR
jgi:HK97 family phage major capsid protein